MASVGTQYFCAEGVLKGCDDNEEDSNGLIVAGATGSDGTTGMAINTGFDTHECGRISDLFSL